MLMKVSLYNFKNLIKRQKKEEEEEAETHTFPFWNIVNMNSVILFVGKQLSLLQQILVMSSFSLECIWKE